MEKNNWKNTHKKKHLLVANNNLFLLMYILYKKNLLNKSNFHNTGKVNSK